MHKNNKEFKKQISLAFKLLEKEGFIVRKDYNFDMCGGVHDIWMEIYEDMLNGKTYKGYVFYHGQDAMFFEEDGVLYLAWGSSDMNSSDRENLEIGKAIVKILKKLNLNVSWEKAINRRISISYKK